MNVELILQTLNSSASALNLEFRGINNFNKISHSLGKFTQLKSLNIQGNEVVHLSNDLRQLIPTLEELDIRNNPVDLSRILQELQSLQNLQRLWLSCERDEEAEIISALPQLRQLNGREVGVGVQKRDLERIAMQYDQIRALIKENGGQSDLVLQRKFDEHIKNVLKDLQLRLVKENNQTIIQTHILRARYALQELGFSQIIDFLPSQIQPMLQAVHDDHAQIFKELTGLILNQAPSDHLIKISKLESQIKVLQIELQEQTMANQALQEENQKYLELIIKHAKQSYNPSPNHNHSDQASPKLNTQENLNITQKQLPLNALKDIITEIYESKETYDQKCIQQQLARETMEQHMFTYFNWKYGLKVFMSIQQSLIIEQASAVIASIKKYQSENNDIMVFGKILRNECDEEFHYVQEQVKATVSELLKMFLQNKYPHKVQSELREVWSNKLHTWITISEAQEIVEYMYNQEDSRQLMSIITQVSEKKIDYSNFQQIILQFQLQTHEKYLQPFIQYFRKVDNSRTGTLDHESFRQLIQSFNIGIRDQDIRRMISILDPHSHQCITFSSIVQLLSAEMIKRDSDEFSVLQLI